MSKPLNQHHNHYTALHLLAAAVMGIWPKTELVSGYFHGNEFFYDFMFTKVPEAGEIKVIEEKMWDLCRQDTEISYPEMMRENAADLFNHRKQVSKAREILQDDYNVVQLIRIGDYTDKCYFQGAFSAKDCAFFKLTNLENFESSNPDSGTRTITRIKGIACADKKKFKKAVKGEDLLKKCHYLKLGQQQSLFIPSGNNSSSLLWTEKGQSIKKRINGFFEAFFTQNSFKEVATPQEDGQKDSEALTDLLLNHEKLTKNRPGQEGVKVFEVFNSYHESNYLELGASTLVASSPFSNKEAEGYLKEILSFVSCFEQAFCLKLQLCLEGTTSTPGFSQWKALLESSEKEFLAYEADSLSVKLLIEDRMAREHQILHCFFDKRSRRFCWSFRISTEELVALMLEELAGEWPLWLSPEIFRLLPISEKQHSYAAKLKDCLEAKGLQIGLDLSVDSLKSRLKNSFLDKVPFSLVIGDEEIEKGSFCIRSMKGKDIEINHLDELVTFAKKNLEAKVFLSENLLLKPDNAE
ncbi:MAG: His/Gly/Thr/Pro-type tRNA ligase C-terminal domain-containing protein [Chlamydiales bacterium]|nr:His/Gly/Thr/Pro-type tRNA ligase C-terminal domain-containing protein [Chlamydiales bacterium]